MAVDASLDINGEAGKVERPGRPKIDLLLATYNGANWLAEQMDSLVAQECQEWRLLARDDGSSDGTPAILQKRLEDLGRRAVLLPNQGKSLGACGNFVRLLKASDADYSMLCDQDDVWLPDKITLTLQKMREMETAYGEETPLMVHTDLRVVDRNLEPVAESGHRFQGLDPVKGAVLGRLLVQNVASGCTVMLNRALRELALPLPGAALMHDHWLSLVASCFGQIGYLPLPTMLYRQHGINRVGAQRWTPDYAARLLLQLPAVRQVMARNRKQAEAFLERYRAVLRDREKEMLETFVRMPDLGPVEKRRAIFRYGFFYAGTLRNLGWLVLC